MAYYQRRYGPRGWTNAVTLNLAIGQGENDQTVLSMARFYSALVTDGAAATPHLVKQQRPKRQPLVRLSPAQLQLLRDAMAAVVSSGTARGSRLDAITIGGKTGTSQNPHGEDHAWFVGFAPVDQPKIVIAVMIEFGGHGSDAARIASKIIAKYLGATPLGELQTEG